MDDRRPRYRFSEDNEYVGWIGRDDSPAICVNEEDLRWNFEGGRHGRNAARIADVSDDEVADDDSRRHIRTVDDGLEVEVETDGIGVGVLLCESRTAGNQGGDSQEYEGSLHDSLPLDPLLTVRATCGSRCT